MIALTASHDEEVQSIACYDIGEFVRHYPNGRTIARSLGAKDIVLKLVDHSNEELSRQALTCVSKMMVQNWQVSDEYFSQAKSVCFLSDHVRFSPPPYKAVQ